MERPWLYKLIRYTWPIKKIITWSIRILGKACNRCQGRKSARTRKPRHDRFISWWFYWTRQQHQWQTGNWEILKKVWEWACPNQKYDYLLLAHENLCRRLSGRLHTIQVTSEWRTHPYTRENTSEDNIRQILMSNTILPNNRRFAESVLGYHFGGLVWWERKCT